MSITSTSTSHKEMHYNIALIGDSGVGKTSIVSKLCNKQFRDNYITTVGIDKETKVSIIDNIKCVTKLWDTTGQERYTSLTTQYLRKADGVFFVYEVNNRNSFVNINKWLKMIKESNKNDALQCCLIANKIDLERVVSEEEGKQMAREIDMEYIETSAKNGDGVNKAYEDLLRKLIGVNSGRRSVRYGGGVDVSKIKQKKKKCC